MSQVWLTVLSGLLMLLGLAGIVLPVLPSTFLIWLGSLIYGLFGEWGRWGPWIFGFITLLGLASLVADMVLGGAGARLRGASLWGIVGGLIAGVIGLVLFSLPGAVAGLLLGTFAVEYIRFRDMRKAADATIGMGVGYGVSFGVKLLIALAMIGLWLVWVFVG
jgi:uncharacterized protein YqgC (DUF456 family)